MGKSDAQIDLLKRFIKEFRNGGISLSRLVQNVEALIDVIDDSELKDGVFSSIVALEEVNARSKDSNFNYDLFGKPVVEKALADIERKIQQFAETHP